MVTLCINLFNFIASQLGYTIIFPFIEIIIIRSVLKITQSIYTVKSLNPGRQPLLYDEYVDCIGYRVLENYIKDGWPLWMYLDNVLVYFFMYTHNYDKCFPLT